MNQLVESVQEFLSQPFGVVGAAAIMAAVTVINVQRLRDRLDRGVGTETVFNGLNLIGGVCLLVNAVIRDEIVWLVLETYFIAIAIKGLVMRANAVAVSRRTAALSVGLVSAVVLAAFALLQLLTSSEIVHAIGELPLFDEVLAETVECGRGERNTTCSD